MNWPLPPQDNIPKLIWNNIAIPVFPRLEICCDFQCTVLALMLDYPITYQHQRDGAELGLFFIPILQ